MKKAETIIKNYAVDFVDKNWKKINKSKCEIKVTKDKIIAEIKRDIFTAVWVLLEVADWGMDKNYINDMIVNDRSKENFYVVKIGNEYIKIEWIDTIQYRVKIVKPKRKTIIYFE